MKPAALSRWFWAAFTDAYEWVELPNVAGMATWGDGGVIASKPVREHGAVHPAHGQSLRLMSLRSQAAHG